MNRYTFLFLFLLPWSVWAQMPAAITISPANATAYDQLTITFTPAQACFQNGSLASATAISMHSGVKFITGASWQNVVDFNAAGANSIQPDLTPNGNGTWSFTFVPKDFYGFPDGSIVTHICAVFNNGTNWNNDGRDFGTTGCADFMIPLSYNVTAPSMLFRVNMNKQIVDGNFNPGSQQVWVEITGQPDLLMENTFDISSNPINIYQAELTTGLSEGQVLEYHFKTTAGEENLTRTTTLSPGPNSVEYWYNNISLASLSLHCNMAYQIADGLFNPATDSLDVAGSFNNWNGSLHQLTDPDGDGVYSLDINPISSGIIEFKFRINGDWNSSEFPGGGANRSLLIPLNNYAFHGIYNNYIPGSVPVTFNCIMEYQISAAHFETTLNYLDICGSYNGWLAGEQLMDIDGDEVYSLTIPVDTTQETSFSYKFRINGDWNTAEFPAMDNRHYTVHNPATGGDNIIEVWYNDLDPFVGTAPIAWNPRILPLTELSIGTTLVADYTYEDPNDDLEGATTFKWERADSPEGLNLTTLSDGTTNSYTLTEQDAEKYIFLSIRPVALTESGSNAAGTLYGDTVSVFAGPVWNLSSPENTSASIHIWPNPTTELVSVSTPSMNAYLKVFSSTGQLIAQSKLDNTQRISLQTQESGVYWFIFYNDDNQIISKIPVLKTK